MVCPHCHRPHYLPDMCSRPAHPSPEWLAMEEREAALQAVYDHTRQMLDDARDGYIRVGGVVYPMTIPPLPATKENTDGDTTLPDHH